MIIKWLDDAINDLQALRQYIAADSLKSADRVAARIITAIDVLSEQPCIGRPGRIFGIRELVVSDTPYIIPYRVKNNVVEILRVFHGAMQWPEEF